MSGTVVSCRRRLVASLAALAVAVSACSVPVDDEPIELSGSIVPDTTTSTSTTSPQVVTREEAVYFLDTVEGTTLQPVLRSIAVGSGLQGVLSNLFDQRPREDQPDERGLSTAIPESATLLSASPDPANSNRLVVDVRGLFGDQGIQGAELRNALAQIVWTATEGTPELEVVFRQDGEPRQALVDNLESTGEPVDRSDYRRSI